MTGVQTCALPISQHKAVIMIFLAGGPPHQDMFDLKPDAPSEVRGEFNPIATNVPGIQISELMPRVASMMDKFAVIRSLVGAEGRHDSFECCTGHHFRGSRSEEHTSELQSQAYLVCRLLLEKKK